VISDGVHLFNSYTHFVALLKIMQQAKLVSVESMYDMVYICRPLRKAITLGKLNTYKCQLIVGF
jgi:hypothetical protein